MWHDSFICVTWMIHKCDMTHSYAWHEWFINVTWRIYMCETTCSHVWHVSFICVTRDTTHSYAWQGSFICVTWLMHTCDIEIAATAITHSLSLSHTHTNRHYQIFCIVKDLEECWGGFICASLNVCSTRTVTHWLALYHTNFTVTLTHNDCNTLTHTNRVSRNVWGDSYVDSWMCVKH